MKNLTVLTFFLTGCAVNSIHINEQDITPYKAESKSQEEFKTPYISSFSRYPFKLTYVAVAHVEGADNDTCRTIQNKFSRSKPAFLLIEGRPYTKINDGDVIDYVKQCEKENYKDCGEDACAISEAIKANIPFNYAEPGDLNVKEHILKTGYTEEDLMFFYGLRQIPQLKRQGVSNESEIRKKVISYLDRSAKRLALKAPLSIDSFEKIYSDKMKKPLIYSAINADDVSPRIDEEPSWINILSHHVGMAREKFIIQMINMRLNEYKNVMIVYGAAHLTKSRPAFEKVFGPAKNEKLFK